MLSPELATTGAHCIGALPFLILVLGCILRRAPDRGPLPR